jgi:integrase
MPLTNLKVRTANPGKHTDRHGLILNVLPSGSRHWKLRMKFKGKRRGYGLGPVHGVSLAEARILAAEIRKMVRAGLDPVEIRGLKRKRAPTFEQVTRKCHESLRRGWKDKRYASWLATFENHIFPEIGNKRIDEIDSQAVLRAIEPIWLEIPDTARRVLQRIGTVLDYAHIKGHIRQEVSLKSVTRGLPRQSKVVTHRAAMPYAKLPTFMAALLALPNSAGRDALKLTVLTGARSNETRFAVWSEFDLQAGIWAIPADRMKMKNAHVIPLSPSVVALLKRLYQERLALDARIAPDQFVFTSNGTKPISDMTMNKAMKDMGFTGVTVHGFRSCFTDWAAECTDFAKEVVEKALAHKVPNAVEAAYRRTDFFDKRRTLMEAWARYCMSSAEPVAPAVAWPLHGRAPAARRRCRTSGC